MRENRVGWCWWIKHPIINAWSLLNAFVVNAGEKCTRIPTYILESGMAFPWKSPKNYHYNSKTTEKNTSHFLTIFRESRKISTISVDCGIFIRDFIIYVHHIHETCVRYTIYVARSMQPWCFITCPMRISMNVMRGRNSSVRRTDMQVLEST